MTYHRTSHFERILDLPQSLTMLRYFLTYHRASQRWDISQCWGPYWPPAPETRGCVRDRWYSAPPSTRHCIPPVASLCWLFHSPPLGTCKNKQVLLSSGCTLNKIKTDQIKPVTVNQLLFATTFIHDLPQINWFPAHNFCKPQ